MTDDAGALRVGLALAKALQARSVPYALGGALAYAQAAVPRATLDVDINVFVTPDELGGVFAALDELEIAFDAAGARQRAMDEGMFEVWAGKVRIDVDLERLIAVQGRRLDSGYIRAQILDMLGETDVRISEWDRLVATHMPKD